MHNHALIGIFFLYVHIEQQCVILVPFPDFLLYLKICSEAQSGLSAKWSNQEEESVTWKRGG